MVMRKTCPHHILTLLLALSVLNVGCSSTQYRHNTSQNTTSVQQEKYTIIKTAKKMLGVKYHYGGTSPGTGFDCSGLVQYTYQAAGIHLPRTTGRQYHVTRPVQKNHLKAGDLVFFRTAISRVVSHVGIYLGKNRFIHAPSSGKKVTISSLKEKYWSNHYTGAGRIL